MTWFATLTGPQTVADLAATVAARRQIAKSRPVPKATGWIAAVETQLAKPVHKTAGPVAHVAHFGVVEGTAPPYGYGHGAAMFRGQATPNDLSLPSGYGYGAEAYKRGRGPTLPGTEWLTAPYAPQFYGRDNHAQLEGYQFGGFTDFITGITSAIQSGATNVENIARGIAVGAQAATTVTQHAGQSGSTIFQPTPADVAARQYDVTQVLGGSNLVPMVILGGGVVLLLLLNKKH